MDYQFAVGLLLCISLLRIEGISCPAQNLTLPHGRVNCTEASCEFECTSTGYSVSPIDHALITCTSNGTWSNESPCCARPCPPYLLFDVVKPFHFSEPSRRWLAVEIETSLLNTTKLAEDAVKKSMFYYSTTPNISSQIKFNDYNANITQLKPLIEERLESINEGNKSNIGAAIRYAMDHLLQPINGARVEQVPKAISLNTDRNSDDDALTPAAEARRRGIQIYVFAYQSPGYNLDPEEFEAITGHHDHVIIFGDDRYVLNDEEIAEHFCADPCVHVLHDHD